ncbi:hypothetical protein [Sinirhodobacter huangdaonensis]|uniref:DD-peptidase zinc-binding domain-containing protein n=1 Tax=Paenirhodobacter huangdaonensis TaxID=2501515 RepID=A0A3S3N758_9RHOB|nr:hypothetical protein [Sinirhodobacter huangdaonensis]RWR48043.1 hypothetical protein EOW66_18790 [Sinirhodobacter huangdaonensis]
MSVWRALLHLAVAAVLTALTQLGGLAWLASRLFRRKLLAFAGLYLALWLGALVLAPQFGRVPIACHGNGPLVMRSWVFCLANRNYVAPELKAAVEDMAAATAATYPGTVTLALDGNFPFLNGFPLLPHLSHNDGRKLDLALYYADHGRYLPGRTRSPLGYFAFEPGPNTCPPRFPTLRWDLAWLQPLWRAYAPDPERMHLALRLLARDPRIGKIFLEPHLAAKFGAGVTKIRFQGCAAARHDDHIHIQL